MIIIEVLSIVLHNSYETMDMYITNTRIVSHNSIKWGVYVKAEYNI